MIKVCIPVDAGTAHIEATLDDLMVESQFAIFISFVSPYMQKAGDCGDISPQFFLDFLQNFRLRMRNQYCTQAIT